MLCFRFNPGLLRSGNQIIGNPQEAKFGCTRQQLLEGYAELRKHGVKRFGLHTMIVFNELDPASFVETARMLFSLAVEISQELDIKLEFVNLGGGLGVPYRPEDTPLDVEFERFALGRRTPSLTRTLLPQSRCRGMSPNCTNSSETASGFG